MSNLPKNKNISGLNIVIIDDDFVVRQVLGLLLKYYSRSQGVDLKIYTSANGLEGMGYLMVTIPDILILDTTLPKYSGTEIADFILNNPRYHRNDLKVFLIEGKDNLSEGFLPLNKSNKTFIQDLLDKCFGYRVGNDRSKWERFIYSVGSKILNAADKSDSSIKSTNTGASLLKKVLGYVKWGFSQVKASILLLFLYSLLGRWNDDNLEQAEADLRKYRIKYYPTLATFIISLIAVTAQIGLLTLGGVTVLNSRIISVFADQNELQTLDNNDASYDSTLIVNEGIVLRLKEIPVEEAIPATEDQLPEEVIEDPSVPDLPEDPEGGSPEEIDLPEEIIEANRGESIDVAGVPLSKRFSTDAPEIIYRKEISYSEIENIYEVSSFNDEDSSILNPEYGYSTGILPSNGITYQLSPDLNVWYFYDGAAWTPTNAGYLTSNSVQEINQNIDKYTAQFKTVFVKSFLISDGLTPVSISSISIESKNQLITFFEQENIVPQSKVEDIEVEVPLIDENIEPKILNASWANGNKIIIGRIDIPVGVQLSQETINNFNVKVYYTSSVDNSKPARNKGELIGWTTVSKVTEGVQNQYIFSLFAEAEPGGYVTSQVEYRDSEGRFFVSELSAPVENSTFSVNLTTDSADFSSGDGICDTDSNLGNGLQCTLRAAIQEANALAGTDTINFAIPASGVQTIQPSTAYPAITGQLHIDGSTQSYGGNSASCNPMSLLVEVDARLLHVSNPNTFTFQASNSSFKGMVVNNSLTSIYISSANNVSISCNMFGIEPDGNTASSHSSKTDRAIDIANSSNTLVGGSTSADRNIIVSRGNYSISLAGSGSGNQILGNYFNSNISGTTALAYDSNYAHILNQATGTIIGGSKSGTTCSGPCNLFVNKGWGILQTGNTTVSMTVSGNHFGLNASGNATIGTMLLAIESRNGSNSLIGGASAAEGNVIAGMSTRAIYFQSFSGTVFADNIIRNNIIGLNSLGTVGLGSRVEGIRLNGGSSDAIYNTLVKDNTISNVTYAIRLFSKHDLTTIESNKIGTNVSGEGEIRNSASGLYLNMSNTSVNTTVGGGSSAEGNIIANNGSHGIEIVNTADLTVIFNTITGNDADGISVTGTTDLTVSKNTISNNDTDGIMVTSSSSRVNITRNGISDNGSLGIDLGDNDVTANDNQDHDTGPNLLLNYPVITGVDGDDLDFTLDAQAGSYMVEFFASDINDPTNYGEGGSYICDADISHAGSGSQSYSLTCETPIDPNSFITATATCYAGGCLSSTAYTSEFSKSFGSAIYVNSTGDAADASAGNGVCETGTTNAEGFPECTLRAAIQEANALSSANEIRFDIPMADTGCLSFVDNGVQGSYNHLAAEVSCTNPSADGDINWWRIQPSGSVSDSGYVIDYPLILGGTTIDATTQTGFVANSAEAPNQLNGQPVIEVRCQQDICFGTGLGGTLAISGFVISSQSLPTGTYGVVGNSIVRGNYIGTDISGLLERGIYSAVASGLSAGECESQFTVGGNLAPERNLMAGYLNVGVASTGCDMSNSVIGNYIGILKDGFVHESGSIYGILVDTDNGLRIGDGTDAGMNVVGGGTEAGVAIYCPASNLVVDRNQIRENMNGVDVWCGQDISIEDNVVNSNQNIGVNIVAGDPSTVSILRNTIYENNSIGINLGFDEVTLNDLDDADLGSNGLQNFPVITEFIAFDDHADVEGLLNSSPNSYFKIEFYASTIADLTGYGEGELYLGYTIIQTDGTGNHNIDLTLPIIEVPTGFSFVTSTATKCSDSSCTTTLGTSEFNQASGILLGGVIGSIQIDQDPVIAGETLSITVVDQDLNDTDLLTETVQITVRNNATNEVEQITLTELNNNSNTFVGTLLTQVAQSGQDNNGVLSLYDNHSVLAGYTDQTTPDGLAQILTDTSSVIVNWSPVAVSDARSTPMGQTVIIGVLQNDSDPNGDIDQSSVRVVGGSQSNPSALIDVSGGEIIYNPGPLFVGYDRFTYEICDFTDLCDQADVFMTVGLASPDAVDDQAEMDEDSELIIEILANDLDRSGFDNSNLNPGSVQIQDQVANGELQVNMEDGSVTYTPAQDFSGVDSFMYQVCEFGSGSLCDSATVSITINNLSDLPLALDDYIEVSVGEHSMIINVLANDIDPDGDLDLSTFMIIQLPQVGEAEIDPESNTVEYRLSDGYIGQDNFIYQVCDSEENCDDATVTVNITQIIPPGEEVGTDGSSIDRLLDTIVPFGLNVPVRDVANTSAVSVSTVVTGSAVTANLYTLGFNLFSLPDYFYYYFTSFISWFGVRKKKEPFGIVYDSVSKEPLLRAVVRIYHNDGRLAETTLTDTFGVFSATLEDGNYRFEAKKAGYRFPSSLVKGSIDDLYQNVYGGELVDIKFKKEINLSIPVDPVETSRSIQILTLIKSKLRETLSRINLGMFIMGLSFAGLALYVRPSITNIVLLTLYIPTLVLIVKNHIEKPIKYAQIIDSSGRSVKGIVVGLKHPGTDWFISKRVTDRNGLYRFIVPKGEYDIEVLTKGYRVINKENISNPFSRKREYTFVGDNIIVESL